MLLNLGASHGQVRAPRSNAAFGHLANLTFGVNKAFEDLCLLKLVLEHTLLGFITVSVGLRHFFILANLVRRESPGDAAVQLVEKKIKLLCIYFMYEIILCIIN